jgi:hypothetical protein
MKHTANSPKSGFESPQYRVKSETSFFLYNPSAKTLVFPIRFTHLFERSFQLHNC